MEIALRPYQVSDVEDFMEWCDDEVVRLSRLRHFTSREDAVSYLKETVIPHPWYRAICLDNRPIGFISITPGSGDERCRGRITYALGSKYWGQGITTVAVKKVISTVFEEFPSMQRLETIVDVDNKRSQRVLEKSGFLKEGVLRKYVIFKGNIYDVIMYSLLSTLT
uniref:Putative Acyl-CoA N-acyltransferases (NAT) superfamily protein n=1 Tax=Davidia involucrata TaxID=16924 RepID=A0A5B7BCG4_DAVIN